MKLSIKDINLHNKRIFLRVDYNVPTIDTQVLDTYKIDCTIPTIDFLLNRNVKSIIIGSHLGRPKGKVVPEMSLRPVYKYLKSIFEKKGKTLLFKNVYEEINQEKPENAYILLENLRFLDEEESRSAIRVNEYTDYFKKYADICVLDAFGVVHRECGSIIRNGLRVVCGLLLAKEMSILENFKDVDLVILGGKKVSDKILLIKKLMSNCKRIYVAGGMCFTFMKYLGREIGDSMCEDVKIAEEIYKESYKINMENKIDESKIKNYDKFIENIKNNSENEHNDNNVKGEIVIPIDFVTENDDEYKTTNIIQSGYKGTDIGPQSIAQITKIIQQSNSVFFNGPPGIFENEETSLGTRKIIEAMSLLKSQNKISIIGGGDTAFAVAKFSDRDHFTHVSTGGGALMMLLEGTSLPGIDIIDDDE